eukprot:SAG31_NODE_321_length_17733_cov_41.320177_4_plen_112_part_00
MGTDGCNLMAIAAGGIDVLYYDAQSFATSCASSAWSMASPLVVRAEAGRTATAAANCGFHVGPHPARQEPLALSLRGHLGKSLMQAFQGSYVYQQVQEARKRSTTNDALDQ